MNNLKSLTNSICFKINQDQFSDGSTNWSCDLMDLGDNYYIPNDELTQRKNRVHRALSIVYQVKKMLEQRQKEMENEEL